MSAQSVRKDARVAAAFALACTLLSELGGVEFARWAERSSRIEGNGLGDLAVGLGYLLWWGFGLLAIALLLLCLLLHRKAWNLENSTQDQAASAVAGTDRPGWRGAILAAWGALLALVIAFSWTVFEDRLGASAFLSGVLTSDAERFIRFFGGSVIGALAVVLLAVYLVLHSLAIAHRGSQESTRSFPSETGWHRPIQS